MKADFAQALRCPACHSDGTLELHVEDSDEREVREGPLRCRACAQTFAVHRGVPELLHHPPSHIVAEAAGLDRFAEHMRLTGWNREVVRRLPEHDSGYWYVQARSMHQLLTTVPFVPGQTVVDVGSNTCWAASHFAERGLRAIALDIATTEMQGLYTAEYFIDDGHVFFERVLGSMDAMPLASSSVDYVFCCEVLHHNDPDSLRRTFTEAFRVLRPGGRLLMFNETLKTLRDPVGVHTEGVEQFEGYEHAHWALQYRWEATRAGFFTEVMEPHYRAFFNDALLQAQPGGSPLLGLRLGAAIALRSSGFARRAYLAWLNHVWGGVQMNMIATKPTRFVGRHEGIGAGRRLLRTLAAGALLGAHRLLGRAPGRLPRTPREAAELASARAAAAPQGEFALDVLAVADGGEGDGQVDGAVDGHRPAHPVFGRLHAALPPPPSDAAELQALVDRIGPWSHSIDLGAGVTTSGVKPAAAVEREWQSFGLSELAGKSVLDVGGDDGAFAFLAERAGAERVAVLDHYPWSVDRRGYAELCERMRAEGQVPPAAHETQFWDPARLPALRQLEVARARLHSGVQAIAMDFMDCDLEQVGEWDVVLYLDRLQRTEEPLRALHRLAAVTCEQAIIETEAVFVRDHREPLSSFFPGGELHADRTIWWVPNMGALLGLVGAAGFSRVEVLAGEPDDDGLPATVPRHYRATVRALK